jgi:hypothetical protein
MGFLGKKDSNAPHLSKEGRPAVDLPSSDRQIVNDNDDTKLTTAIKKLGI